MAKPNKCTCRSGRDYDGSEFAPCEHCELEHDQERVQAALIRDAARWRISQITYPRMMDDPFGFFIIEPEDSDDDFSVGIQPHPTTKKTAVNACILGEGPTREAAIDHMFLALDELVDGGAILPPEIEAPRALASTALKEQGDE